MQEPCGMMVGLAENIQACLGDFLAGTASMARKRHLASSARGLLCFCLMTLVTTGLTRSIRPIRVRNKPILWRTALQAALVVCYLYRGRCPRLLFGSALQAPECLWFYSFTTDLTDWTDCYLCEAKGKTKTGKTGQ